MNNTRLFQIGTATICIVLGALIFRIHTDQEFIHLTPSEGSEFLVSLKYPAVFEQKFAVQGQSLSKVGVFLVSIQPRAKNSTDTIRIALLQNNAVVAEQDIPVFQIDGESASFLNIEPAIATSKGEFLSLQVTSSPEASGLVALQKRMFDESFPDRDISFAIDAVKQQYPVAYSVFERIWPPFVQQLGGLLVLAGFFLLFWNAAVNARMVSSLLALIAIAVLYAIPALQAYPLFLLLTILLLVGIWCVLRIAGRTILASFFGAFIFACSTWLPLYLITGGEIEGMLPIRDALIDPNQISVSHGAGGYVGIPGALFAAAGVLIWIGMIIRKRFAATHIDTVMTILLALSMFISFVDSPIQNSQVIIVVVACIAWFASLAFDKLQRFLGARDTFVQILLVLLLAISLLDLMHITARSFSYGIGI